MGGRKLVLPDGKGGGKKVTRSYQGPGWKRTKEAWDTYRRPSLKKYLMRGERESLSDVEKTAITRKFQVEEKGPAGGRLEHDQKESQD